MVNPKATGISPPTKQRTRQTKLEEIAREIREYPLISVANANGRGAFGEIQRLKSGEWEARVFGQEYQTDRATFSDYEQAGAWMLLRRDGFTNADAAKAMKHFMDEAPAAGAGVDIKKLIEGGRD